jgi:hypothetical protein
MAKDKLDRKNIQMIEYEVEMCGEVYPKVALFNQRRISEGAVNQLILSGEKYNDNVIFMHHEQYNNVFLK